MGRIKARTDSMYSQILNHRPHWDFLRTVTPPPLRRREETGYHPPSAFQWQNIPPSPKHQNKPPDRQSEQQHLRFPKFDLNLDYPQSEDLQDNIPVICEIVTPGPDTADPRPDSRPSYILLNGGPAYRSGLAGPNKFTPDSPYRAITPDSTSNWTTNNIFSPKIKPQSPLIMKSVNNNLDYSPCVLDQESYINRLSNVEFTPTFGKVVDNIYNTICDYSDIEHPCCPPKPEKTFSQDLQKLNHLVPEDGDKDAEQNKKKSEDYKTNVDESGKLETISPVSEGFLDATSCFSVLSTPFEYDEYQPEFTVIPNRCLEGFEADYNKPGENICYPPDQLILGDLIFSDENEELEFKLDDFVQTPGANTLCSPSQVTVFPAKKTSVRSVGYGMTSLTRPRTLSIKTLESYYSYFQPFIHRGSRNSSLKVNVDSTTSLKHSKPKQIFSPIDSIISFFSKSSSKHTLFSPILSASPTSVRPPPGSFPSPKIYPDLINYRALDPKQNPLLNSLIEHDINHKNNMNNVRKTKKLDKCKKMLSPFVSPVKSPFKIFSRNASPKNTTIHDFYPSKVGEDGMIRPDNHRNQPNHQPYPQSQTLSEHLYSNVEVTNTGHRLLSLNGHTSGLDPTRVINVDRSGSYVTSPTMVASPHQGSQSRELYQVSLQEKLSPEDRQLHKLSILDEGLLWEGFDGPRGTPEGDEVLKVISNCEPTDVLLPTLLKDNVCKVERRLLFYFKQLKNVKYCYDIVEKVCQSVC